MALHRAALLSAGPARVEPLQGYYLQDARSTVGNDMLFWGRGGNGYTTNLDEAEVYTLDAALKQQAARHSDVPWPVAYIRSKSRPAVDFQYVKRSEVAAHSIGKDQA